MALTEEDKQWILDAIRGGNQSESASISRLGSSATVRRSTKTAEELLIGGVRLAGLGLAVMAKMSQITTRAIDAGVEVYVNELGTAMNQKHSK